MGCAGGSKRLALAKRGNRSRSRAAFPPEFARRVYTVAIRRAARDAHRVCDQDAGECATCQEHARAIAGAKWALIIQATPLSRASEAEAHRVKQSTPRDPSRARVYDRRATRCARPCALLPTLRAGKYPVGSLTGA